ncbi:hypothetical protein [Streptomyces sp. NBC_01320]|uniref:hypothetical protein n=1 Tax=Streptomyces sp. NBC_01320 TaxID=2903824 RepID=UPI002E10F6F8|nr:hypothetical protein OG395_35600 [Streptomyces sp. NBC_01320]
MVGLGFTVEMLPVMTGRLWTADAATPVWIVAICLLLSGFGLMAWGQRSAPASWPLWNRKN